MEHFGTQWMTLNLSNNVHMLLYLNIYDLVIINFAGSSGDILSNLSAGVHHIIFKFIPTKLSDAYIVLKTLEFKIKPTGI